MKLKKNISVFVCSPSDVADERSICFNLLQKIPYDPGLIGKIAIDVVAWDSPGQSIPMLASIPPQEAINQGLAQPSDCDIFVLVLWSRIGTPLSDEYIKPNGSRYLSGTEWEYMNAMDASRQKDFPQILVYRRMQTPVVSLNDPLKTEKELQWESVQQFFNDFVGKDGAITGGVNEYGTPNEFGNMLDSHIRTIIHKKFIDNNETNRAIYKKEPQELDKNNLSKLDPYIGLRPFTAKDYFRFYGRGAETDLMIDRIRQGDSKFISIVGASGVGKSSLLAAGVVPRLQDGAIEGSDSWLVVKFSPGETDGNPFASFAIRNSEQLEQVGLKPRDVGARLLAKPNYIVELVDTLLIDKPMWAEVIILVDQLEELFTIVLPEYRELFIDFLSVSSGSARIRMLSTLRADFYQNCIEYPRLAKLFKYGTFPLSPPNRNELFDMIYKPAAFSGIEFEDGLILKIVDDTGEQPGNLPLMAFTLSELFEQKSSSGKISFLDYANIGGVEGAISGKAESVYTALENEVRQQLSSVVQTLVELDEKGTTTRKIAQYSEYSKESRQFVDAFVEARLFTASKSDVDVPTVEVSHEILLESWPRLSRWIEEFGSDIRYLAQLRSAALEWTSSGKLPEYLWPRDRITYVLSAISNLDPKLTHEESQFIQHDYNRHIEFAAVMEHLSKPEIENHTRIEIQNNKLTEELDLRSGIGLKAGGLPDIEWCKIPDIDKYYLFSDVPHRVSLSNSYISMFPVTWRQWQSFLITESGFWNDECWLDISKRSYRKCGYKDEKGNFPITYISWFDAMAFCHWISTETGMHIRLPNSWEWFQAACAGNEKYQYPWGNREEPHHANTKDSGIGQTTVVGLYPNGRSSIGALDMCGNVWEWCLNGYSSTEIASRHKLSQGCLCGGSWHYPKTVARNGGIIGAKLDLNYADFGFRVVLIDSDVENLSIETNI